jgi:hypothetical protein
MTQISAGRRVTVIMLVLLSLLSLGVGVSVILGYTGNATSSQVEAGQKRADCKTVANSERGAVLDARDNLQFAGLIALATSDQTGIEAARMEAPDMKDALAVLPPLDQIVAHGWHVPPVVRRVVPKLPAYIAPCPN